VRCPFLSEIAAGAGHRRHKGPGKLPARLCVLCQILPESGPRGLQRLHVGSLPTLGTLDYVELYGLAFLQTLETT